MTRGHAVNLENLMLRQMRFIDEFLAASGVADTVVYYREIDKMDLMFVDNATQVCASLSGRRYCVSL